MDLVESRAYLRALLAVKAIQQDSQSSPANESAIAGPSPSDIYAWQAFVLRSTLDTGCDKVVTKKQCALWTRLMCCWVEHSVTHGRGASDTVSDMTTLYARVFLPTAQTVLTQPEFSRIEGMVCRDRPGYSANVECDKAEEAYARLGFALSRSAAALTRDVLQITWDLVNPKVTPVIVGKRLELLGPVLDRSATAVGSSGHPPDFSLSSPTRNDASLLAALAAVDQNPDRHTVIHVACLEPLLTHLRGSPTETSLSVDAQCDLFLYLTRVVYDVVTKLNAGVVEQGYFALPFVVDLSLCCDFVTDASMKRDLEEACRAVDAAVETALARQLANIMASYPKTAMQTKHIVPVANARTTTVSRSALEVLQHVVEPSLNVLRRYREGQSEQKLTQLVQAQYDTLTRLVQGAWAEFAFATEKVKFNPKIAARAKEDLGIIMVYLSYY